MIKIEILDSTLRDGAQSDKISYSIEDKIAIANLLTKVGIHFIEAGYISSNKKDEDFFQLDCVKNNKKITAFCSTRRKDEIAKSSKTLDISCGTVCIFGKTSLLHVDKVIKTSREENLQMIFDSIKYLKQQNKYVIFDAEHFFDSYNEDKDYAVKSIDTAIKAGANVICLCDTNGGAMPDFVFQTVSNMVEKYPSTAFGIHCHDDSGLATANSIMAVKAGARHVQGTFIGNGERCGNANLSSIIPDLQLKCGYDVLPLDKIEMITETARTIAEISNITLNPNMPYVGRNAFSHKAGMHADGVLKDSSTFEHIPPNIVGNNRRFLLSEQSGKAIVYDKIKHYIEGISRESKEVSEVVKALKEMESSGYQYEGAEASFILLVKKTLKRYSPTFNLIDYTCNIKQEINHKAIASATVHIDVKDKTMSQTCEGDGPVHALDKALRNALLGFYDKVGTIKLLDYKVRVLSTNKATASKVRVLITSTDGINTWTTVGVSTDIIEASWNALVDSFEYKLLELK